MTSEDRRATRPPFDSLPREQAPPTTLEDRIVERLRERRQLRRSDHRARGTRRWLLPLAASILGVALGWALRGVAVPAAPPEAHESPLFLLLLSGDPVAGPTGSERVALYRRWAIGLARAGVLVEAEKLTAEGVVLEGTSAPVRPLSIDAAAPSGFFLIRAASLDEAVRLARECPHARLGGRVTVRPVDPV